MSDPDIHSMHFNGERAWDKRYEGRSRRWRLRALDLVVRALDVSALRPPPHRTGAAACAIEKRRLTELAATGVLVPRVLQTGTERLLLSDMGQTLAHRLRTSNATEAGRWFSEAAWAIAKVHRQDAYLGQPLARNLTVDAHGNIGFLDFEEDPVEVMTRTDAQVRDWLLFAAGTARHLPHDERELGELLRPVLASAHQDVRENLRSSVKRLGFLAWLAHLKRSRAAGIGKAIRMLKIANTQLASGLLLVGLSLDYLHDGDFEMIEWIVAWIG